MCAESQILASHWIRALVCCYPRDIRIRRLMLMLQGYVDDSGSDESREPFVLAGFLLHTEQWALFSDDWQFQLAREPRIACFKMAEAAQREGQFAGMPEEFVRCKLNDLLSVIRKHRPEGFYCFLDWSEYRKIIAHRELPEHIRNPYHLLFPAIFDCIRMWQLEKGIFPEPVDVDFDEQGRVGQLALLTYPSMKENCDADTRRMLGRIPLMLDDEKVMPLQAADMLAWNIRREHDMDEDRSTWGWLYDDLSPYIKLHSILSEEILAPTLERYPLRP